MTASLVACGDPNAADDDASSGGNTSGGNTSGGNTSGGNTSGGNTSGGNTSGGNGSSGGASSGTPGSTTDGIKNGDETDVDCGGANAPACADNKACLAPSDCTSAVCTGNVCQVPSAIDETKNGDETDVDCGGPSAPACATDKACVATSDCASLVCTGNLCRAATSTDGIKNGNETDIDCGGQGAPTCADNLTCAVPTDCASAVCTGNVCQVPNADDDTKNGDETDVDCGGANAPACADLAGCALPRDCTSLVCTGDVCQVPTANDLTKNGNETDVDCGGPNAPRCQANQACAIANDCDSRFCTAQICEPRQPGRKDGDETDVDCGGLVAPACDWDKTCAIDSDCTSGACVANKCLTGPSCRAHFGGETCGTGEDPPRPGLPANHQSCCRSLPVSGYADPRPAFAGKTVYLDKYEITAGRMREFLRVIGNGGEPNVQAYMAAHRPPRWDQRWEELLPLSNYVGSTKNYTITNPTAPAEVPYFPGQDIFGPTSSQGSSWWVDSGPQTINTGVYRALGGPHLFPEFRSDPSWGYNDYSASHGMNCGNQNQSYGLSTYYFPADIVSNPAYGNNGVSKAFTQAQMDQKALNCAPTALFAAFCAWDGGQLATSEVVDYVTNNGARFLYQGADCQGSGGVPLNVSGDGSTACYSVYYYPFGGTTADDSGRIAAPGRVTGDVVRVNAGDEPWNDLNGNLAEVTLAPNGRFARRGWGLGWASVDSHHQLQISMPRFKGSAFGARCMRFK